MNAQTVVIVGAGLAGARTAETLRAEGFDGRIMLLGDEPVAPYERPALSKEFLAGKRDERSLLLRPPTFWAEQGIELLLRRRVIGVNPPWRTVQLADGEELGFDHLVVATGARPRRLPLETAPGVHVLRSLADATALREELRPGRRLVVIGGGFVGAEVASTARTLGVDVAIVEATAAPVARVLGVDVGHLLANRWRAHGVDVRLASTVAAIRTGASGRIEKVVLGDGSELAADCVLVGIGIEPARELLPRRPSLSILTAGDVSGPGHWTAASHDGVAAAHAILGLPPPAQLPSYVWSDQFGLRLQIIGTPQPEHALEISHSDDAFSVRYHDHSGVVRAGLLANRPAEVGTLRRELAGNAVP